MAHSFMTTTTTRSAGRPASRPMSFAAALLAKREGVSNRHARRLLLEDLRNLDGRDWFAVCVGIDQGIASAGEFIDVLEDADFVGR